MYKLKEMDKIAEKDIVPICNQFGIIDNSNCSKIMLADLMESDWTPHWLTIDMANFPRKQSLALYNQSAGNWRLGDLYTSSATPDEVGQGLQLKPFPPFSDKHEQRPWTEASYSMIVPMESALSSPSRFKINVYSVWRRMNIQSIVN